MYGRSRIPVRRWAAFAVLVGLASDQPPTPSGSDHVTTWHVAHPDFGGFSAIELTADGREFLALTDQGVVFAGTFKRHADGRIAAVDSEPPTDLLDENGIRLDEDRDDTEGLALWDHGGFMVSFEGPAEVLDYPSLGAPARPVPQMPGWQALGMNSGLEALAVDPDGTVLALPEMPHGNFLMIGEFRSGTWVWGQPISANDGFRPVAADFGPNGRLYLLERRFVFPGGFASRLRKFSQGDPNGRLIWSSPPGRHGNLEGLSIWRDPMNGLTATMISDDNFLSLLQTQLVEIVIGD
jgi:hypothetical protein